MPDRVALGGNVSNRKPDEAASPREGLEVILTRTTFVGSVSGADEALVRYALQLHGAGHLHSVVLLQLPPEDSPFLIRLRAAGISVHGISTGPPFTEKLLLAIWRLAIRLKLIPHPDGVPAEHRAPTQRSLPRRAWHRLWLLATQIQAAGARRHFAASSADLVHVVGSDLGALVLIPAARGAGLPVLFHELGCAGHLPQLRLHYEKLGQVLPQCTEVAALSPALARGWRDFYALERPVRVLPLIYDDTQHARPAPRGDDLIRIGYVARLEQGKGVMFLLDAFARVYAAQPRVRLVIAGVGPLEEAARSRATSLGLASCCEFSGYVPEAKKPQLLVSLDVFVLPSLAEGTPNSILEAMLYGIAVIASDVGGIPDMLADGAGVLVPPGNVDALASAMLRLAEDAGSREELGRRGRQRYERLFRPDVVLEALIHEYRRVAKRREGSDLAGRPHPWVQDDTQPPHVGSSDTTVGTLMGAA